MNSLRSMSIVQLACLFVTPEQAVPVDLELQLLVDVSGSVDDDEFELQRDGYVDAFEDAGIQSAIMNGAIGSIAVQYIYWSSFDQQAVSVDWTLIDSKATSDAFAAAIAAAPRSFSGFTGVQNALDFGVDEFADNGFEGTRLVMDVSGDGADNECGFGGICGTGGRDAALAVVDTINGVVIGGEAGVFDYYQNSVIGGDNAFVVTADNFDDFGAAVNEKILKEISVVPVPTTLLLMGLGFAGLGYQRRKQIKAA